MPQIFIFRYNPSSRRHQNKQTSFQCYLQCFVCLMFFLSTFNFFYCRVSKRRWCWRALNFKNVYRTRLNMQNVHQNESVTLLVLPRFFVVFFNFFKLLCHLVISTKVVILSQIYDVWENIKFFRCSYTICVISFAIFDFVILFLFKALVVKTLNDFFNRSFV